MVSNKMGHKRRLYQSIRSLVLYCLLIVGSTIDCTNCCVVALIVDLAKFKLIFQVLAISLGLMRDFLSSELMALSQCKLLSFEAKDHISIAGDILCVTE